MIGTWVLLAKMAKYDEIIRYEQCLKSVIFLYRITQMSNNILLELRAPNAYSHSL
jgi:hypothetical protein